MYVQRKFGKAVLASKRESDNAHGPFAVAVVKEDNIVGHLPRIISAPCNVFLGKPGCPLSVGLLVQGGQEIYNRVVSRYLVRWSLRGAMKI